MISTTRKHRPPTARQKEILDFIARQSRSNNHPTIRDVMHQFGMSSPNAAWCHIRALVSKGLLIHNRGRSRGLVVVSLVDEENKKDAVVRAALHFIETGSGLGCLRAAVIELRNSPSTG